MSAWAQSSSPLVCVLLAGGRSRRMGQDKRFLVRDGKTWLQQAFDLLKALQPEEGSVLVSGSIEGYDGIPDLMPDQGPLMGLYSVMSFLWSKGQFERRLLIIPVDMPLLSFEVLNGLIDFSLKADVAISAYKNNELPMLLKLNENTKSVIESLLQGERTQRSFRQLQAQLKVQWLESAEEKDFTNFNSPHDLELL